MRRLVNAAPAAILLLLLAAPAGAQVWNALDRQAGIPSGLALPIAGVAAAEEPAGMGTTPAAAGFVGAFSLQWFREWSETEGAPEDSLADGLYLAAALGPVGVGTSIEWVRPGDAGFRRYRKNSLVLALGDGRALSVGLAWNRFTSPDPAVEPLSSWDAGITLRPSRHLSLAAAMTGRDARIAGTRRPTRWSLGVATRFLDDRITLSTDLLADDRARDDFHVTHLAAGASAEVRLGLALALQVAIPLRDVPGISRDPSAVLALSWNGPHLGVTGGFLPVQGGTGTFGGVRTSGERYRSRATGATAAALDLPEELRPGRFFLFAIGERDPFGRLLQRLATLRDDPDVAIVALQIEGIPAGPGRVEELRAAIRAIRDRKPVIAYVLGGGTTEYWLSTAATAIAAPPGATLDVTGLAASRLYLRDALARIGVSFEVIARGAYKSAPEPLVRSGASPEAREAAEAVLDDVFGRFLSDVAAARGLPPERVRALVDRGLLGTEEAKTEGLLDEVLWPDELEAFAGRIAGRRVRLALGHQPAPERRAQRWGRTPVIEVIGVTGTIVTGKSRPIVPGGEPLAGAETIAGQLRRAAADRGVKAIVLRVDSPGGDGLASDLIWRAVARARARKPVVASMGDVAASGGYLAAAGADAIVAQPSTLTGSIGVFALKPDLSGLLGKLSVGREAFARGENAQLDSGAKPWSESERRAVERRVEAFYGLFVERVAKARELERSEVEAVAGGRVWTGRQAFDRRLVDRLGSLADAVALARERAGLAPSDPVEIRRAGGGPGGIPEIVTSAGPAEPSSQVERLLSALPEVRALALLSEMGPILALPVEWVLSAP